MSELESDPERDAIIAALIEQVPFDGWTSTALRHALAAAGRPEADAALLFPGGAREMIEAWADYADRDMIDAARHADLAAYRVPARVRAVIALRLERNRGHKDAISRALAILALPGNAGLAARMTARTVDAIWHAAGDRSADFSWYTKRAILAGVYTSTLLYWLRDMSEDDEDTMAFLDRRLQGAGRITRIRRRIESCADRLPFRRKAPSPRS